MAQIVYPKVAAARGALEKCYGPDHGRVAVEPVLRLCVSLLQYLEGLPDRQAVERLCYHAGWNFALNRQLGDELFHHTTLCNFRQRLLENKQSALGFQTILDALAEAGLVSRQSRQRLNSTQRFGWVSRMSRLDCVRESLRLALQELEVMVGPEARPVVWLERWERYVESQTDDRAGREALARKLVEAGTDRARLLEWARGPSRENFAPGPQRTLLERVFGEPFEMSPSQAVPQDKGELSWDRVQNPHDAEATYALKGEGKKKKEHVGYKVQVAETVTQAELGPGEPTAPPGTSSEKLPSSFPRFLLSAHRCNKPAAHVIESLISPFPDSPWTLSAQKGSQRPQCRFSYPTHKPTSAEKPLASRQNPYSRLIP